MSFNLTRNSKLFASTVSAAWDTTNNFEIPILEGFSFSQGTDVQEVQLNEAGATPVRGTKAYNTALNPVEFSFQTYIRPRKEVDGGGTGVDHHNCIELLLWEALVGAGPLETNAVPGTSSCVIDFASSNVHQLLALNLYFQLDSTYYVISGAVVNQAEIDFSIDGIAMVTWSGMGLTLASTTDPSTWVADTDYLSADTTADFITNKLSTLVLDDNSPSKSYTVALTGGQLVINNNITFLTPASLGVLNTPIAHFTGPRSVTGSLSCYLRSGANNSQGLLDDLVGATTETTNSHTLTVNLGGTSAPYVTFDMQTAHLSIPNPDVQDVISLNIDFHGLDSDIDQTDGLVVTYYADMT